jgi:DNA polymerase-3 subunit epsilon
VIDLETTGGSPDTCGITEVGAVKLRGGECLGTFQTLVNPGGPIPAGITVLTGITDTMVLPAPDIDGVLPALLEFVGGSVIVGHNVRFDVSFLDAALRRADRSPVANRVVDTCALARRLVRDEVPNCRLGTLSERFRLDHRPTHRALDDALATGDLLHVLLERAAAFGVLGLDDLVSLPTMAGHPQASKLRLTTRLPRKPGVYVFRDRAGRALYVGKATNLRSRVRSYFSTDDRRKIGALLREAHAIDHVVCADPLEASVLEVRLIHQLLPRYNRQLTGFRRAVYLKLTAEPFPRLAVVRVVRDDGALYVGPLPSARVARRVAEAIESAVPLRRCTLPVRPGRPVRDAPCSPAQLGVSTCPCAGAVTLEEYAAIAGKVVRGLRHDPGLLLAPLHERMVALAADERFEEAADVRDRADALSSALRRQRRFDGLRRSGRVVLELPGGGGAELHGGELVRTWRKADAVSAFEVSLPFTGACAVPAASRVVDPRSGSGAESSPVACDLADELTCVAAWLDRYAHRVRLVVCDGSLSSALPPLPSFTPRRPRASDQTDVEAPG